MRGFLRKRWGMVEKRVKVVMEAFWPLFSVERMIEYDNFRVIAEYIIYRKL